MSASELLHKVIGPKRRWKAYKKRVNLLPENHRTVVLAIERYAMHFVPDDHDSSASMFENLVDLFEQAAVDGTPIRAIVGENPLEFAEDFVKNYSDGGYVPPRVRKRLIEAVSRVANQR